MAYISAVSPRCRAAALVPTVAATLGLVVALSGGPVSAQSTASQNTASQNTLPNASANMAMLPPPGSAYRLNGRALGLGYDVYIGGVYAFHFDALLSVDDHTYDIELQGGTIGFIGRMFSWQANIRSTGGFASDKPTPTNLAAGTFESANMWQGKPHRTTLRFHDDGRYDVALDPPEEAQTVRADGAPPDVLPAGTLDPVAASIAALTASARDGACARRETVFDGKRYYELIVRDGDGDDVVPPSHLSAYSGPALKCRFAMKRLAGFSTRRYAQFWDDEKGTLPTIWSASIVPEMPLVPVRFLAPINIAGNLGSLMAHLVHADVRENGTTKTLLDLEKKR
jgi:hypothetical protein